VGVSGKDMSCSGCAVYGPRTSLYIALKDVDYAFEFSLTTAVSSARPAWNLTRRISKIEGGELFAPANMRAANDNPGYKALLSFYMNSGCTLRYTGAMVPDVVQLLVKGKGVFCSPISPAARPKLRVLYECIPMAFLVECAGGASTDGNASMLNRVVTRCDERAPICLGSHEEVERYKKYCGGTRE
jgi:sedoheptulose-bisphosphatase